MPFSSKEINDSLFRQIYESGMIGLMFTTFDGKIVEANKAFLDFIGYTADDVKRGKLDWKEITPPEFMEVTLEAIHNLKTIGIAPAYEKEYFRKDGTRIQVLMGSVNVKNAKHYDNMTYAIDITQRKGFEKESRELAQTNSFLQSLIENIPNMLFVKDAKDLKFVRFNKAGEKLLGIDRETLMGKSDYDFFPKEEAEFFIQKDRAVLESKIILDIPEEPITTINGIRILHTKKIPILDENNEAKFLIGISEDITEVKKSEQERVKLIREQAAREEAEKNVTRLELLADASTLLTSSLDYQLTIKNFYDFMISRMADWCHITINKPYEADTPQFVYETSPLSDNVRKEIKEYRWKLIKDIDEAILGLTSEKSTLEDIKNEGFKSLIHVHLKTRGNNIGDILLGIKYGSEKSFSLADLQLVEELAEKAGLAIDNSRLFSEAQKANQLKDEFLATLSHELRTPLNIIHGYSELLKNFSDTMSEKEKTESLDAIHRNAVDQTNIVNDILDVSRIITGKMNLNLALLSPADIITSVAKNTSRMATVKNIQLITQLPKVPIFVMMDQTRLQQIIWNLVSNAVKFTSSGGEVIIKNYLEEKFCVIEVEDNGVGVSPKFLPYIFERFRQEDGSMTRKFGGLGLGLAIVRHLVEMHGGSVEAKSEGKDQGSRFIVRIPVAIATTAVKLEPPPGFKENALENIKILIVEDSRDNRLLITRLLATYSADIKEADSAEMARELLKTYSPDIILCDIGMPEEDGLEFITKLRKTKNKIPAIALTAYARDEERDQFLAAGFQSHVAKPVSIQTLLTEIKKLI